MELGGGWAAHWTLRNWKPPALDLASALERGLCICVGEGMAPQEMISEES